MRIYAKMCVAVGCTFLAVTLLICKPAFALTTKVPSSQYKIIDSKRNIACFRTNTEARVGLMKSRNKKIAKITSLPNSLKRSLGKKKQAKLQTRCLRWAQQMQGPIPVPSPTPTNSQDSIQNPSPSDPESSPTPTPTPTSTVRPSATDCTHFASPTGGGNGSSKESAFHIAEFWNQALPGKVLCLLDGEYSGANSMITPPSGLSGVSGAPITVKAYNDGKARLNGEGERQPVALNDNDWMVFEGFNAWNSIYHVIGAQNCNHDIFRRIVAWDAKGANTAVFQLAHSEHNLLEDSAFFGYGHYTVSTSQHGDYTTIRRVWARFEGVDGPNGVSTYSLGYNSYFNTVDNIIGTWDNVRSDSVQNPHTIIGATSENETDSDKKAFTKISGSLAYTTEDQRVDELPGGLLFGGNIAEVTVQDTLSIMKNSPTVRPGYFSPFAFWAFNTQYYNNSITGGRISAVTGALGSTHPDNGHYYVIVTPGVSSPTTQPSWPTDGSTFSDGTAVWRDAGLRNLKLQNVTTVGTTPNIVFGWDQVGYTSGTALSSAYASGQTPFNATTGANLCYRYENGVKTNEPLWPWPMNQRIIDAITTANQLTPQYTRKVTDVTKTVSDLLGQIPPECCDETQGTCQ